MHFLSVSRSFNHFKRTLKNILGIQFPKSYIDCSKSGSHFDKNSIIVKPDVITKKEAELIWNAVKKRVTRRVYNDGHWDGVISQYREVEIQDEDWNDEVKPIIERLRHQILSEMQILNNETIYDHESFKWLPVHVLDLAARGWIDPHVDSIKFSGQLVCGLSLMSPSIMTLRTATEKNKSITATTTTSSSTNIKDNASTNEADMSTVRFFMPENSLYIMSKQARYHYTHSIRCPQDGEQEWEGVHIPSKRRLSLLFRDTKNTARKDLEQ